MEKCSTRDDLSIVESAPSDTTITGFGFQRPHTDTTRVGIAFPAAAYDSRTVIIVGCGHGGVAEVARVVAALGVRMVDESQPDAQSTMEDGEFIASVVDPRPEPDGPRFPGLYRRIGRIIARRNATHGNWGWTDPSVDLYLDGVIHQVRNPLLLFVLRNALDVGLSQVAAGEQSLEAAVDQILQRYARCWALVSKLGLPTLFVGFERALAAPEQFVLDVAEFLRLDPSREQFDAAVTALRLQGWAGSRDQTPAAAPLGDGFDGANHARAEG